MTDIRMTNDRIIFDGHADTKQECETITLLCDNLAKSQDFKTVKYESGYAEFEKVGRTNELKFGNADVIINFDSHITKVTSDINLSEPTPTVTTATWTTSGENIGVLFGSRDYVFNVVLADGYVIDSVTGTETPYSQDAQPITFSEITDNSFTFALEDNADYTITITSKIPAAKQTIDVSTLSGWNNLASGNHSITVKTKADGYEDSEASNAVTVNKEKGYTVTFSDEESGGASGDAYYSLDDGATWTQFCAIWSDDNNDLSPSSLSDVTKIKLKIEIFNLGLPPFGVKLVCSELGMSLGGKNTGTFISDNYTLTEDVTIIITT